MEFNVLGPVEVRVAGQLVDVGHARQLAVLAVLVLDVNRAVPTESLIDRVWGEDPPPSVRNVVYVYVAKLRAALARTGEREVAISRRSGGYALQAGEEEVDLFRFRRQVAEAGAMVGDDELAAQLLKDALGLWRGAALAGLGSPWLDAMRDTLEFQRTAAVLDLNDIELRQGRHDTLISQLIEQVPAYPAEERLVGQLMLALYRSGRQAEALRRFEQARRRLAEELGASPGPGLRALHQQILRSDRSLALPESPGRHAGAAPQELPAVPQVRYSLPADVAAFTGRGGELGLITAVAAGAGGVVAVGAVDGMPGVGKTALAVRAAHALAGQFPDRQLFVDLHAHTPGREPVRPEDALAGLLGAVGVDLRYLPADLAGRAAMWRDKMAGQRALLVLDNAASSGQVMPLLPGDGGHLVLVTSRRRLGDLPGAVTPVLVDALPPHDAADMFARLAPRAAADRGGVAEVVALAGFLPLAVSLLARVYARHPSWSLADLIAETRAGVLTLAAERDSVAAAFEVSYRHLDPDSQRLFRLLGVHPGTTIDGYAAAALAGTGLADAAGLLDGLHREGLVTEVSHRRYVMHDLIRRYAQDLAAADPAADRGRALGQLLDYYQHAASAARALLARQSRPRPPSVRAVPAAVPGLPDRERALAWARAERGNLLACLDHAARHAQHARVVALTSAVAGLLRQDGPWAEALARHDTAARAARHLGDRLGEADALSDLGVVRWLTGDYPGAAGALQEALGIYRDLGDRQGQGNALTELGAVRRLTDDYPGAAGALGEALGIYRDLGDRLGQAGALRQLGGARLLTGDYPGAASAAEEALSIYRDLGNQVGQGDALRQLGGARLRTGDYPGAAGALQEALGIYRDLGDRLGQGSALSLLGIVRRRTGDYPGAVEAAEEALGIYRDLGHRLGQAGALGELGVVRRLTGDYPGAAGALQEALGFFRALGDRGGEAEVLNEAGTLHRVRGDLGQAGTCHRQALNLARQIGSSRDEACALAGQGRCALAGGDAASGQDSLRQAQEIFRRIGAAEASDVTAELSALTQAGPPSASPAATRDPPWPSTPACPPSPPPGR